MKRSFLILVALLTLILPGLAAEDLASLKAKAEKGDAAAQFDLGKMYDKGEGVAQDFQEAVKLFRNAAEQGNADAQYRLGEMYYEGEGGLTKDPVEAVKWYRKAAEQGNAAAQYRLGEIYYEGEGGLTKDLVEAVKWYRKAAEQGHTDSQNSLGDMYKDGKGGLTKDPVEAVKWYRKAAEQGNIGAQMNLGKMYDTGFYVTQNKAEAAKWYRKAADQENSLAQYYLGLMYFKGEGVIQDKAEAAKWLRKSAEQGYIDALFILGVMYRKGEGVPRNEEEASNFFNKATEQGDESNYYDFGKLLDEGKNGITQDKVEAFKWYLKAAEGGRGFAQFKIGEKYAKGEGVTKNISEAAKWYRKAAEQEIAEKDFILGIKPSTFLIEKVADVFFYGSDGVLVDKHEAFKLYRIAVERDSKDVAVLFNLGIMYDNGEGVAQDKAEAVKWYRKAAEQGVAEAQFNLGLMYAKGEGVTQDKAEAAMWWRLAAARGNATAQYNLGLIYDKGEGVHRDRMEAAKWYRKAAEKGVADAQFNLGIMYSKGEGVSLDKAEAAKWYRKAAEQGYADAQFNLAVCYVKGEGVLRSSAAAADWYYRAGANYLKNGNKGDALLCVERIKNLQSVFGLTIPNIQLADDLLREIYGRQAGQAPPPAPAINISIGTAWVLSTHLLATNHHVVEGRKRILVVFPGGAKCEASVDTADRINDIVFLRVQSVVPLPPPLPLAGLVPKSGTEVFSVGYPLPDIMGKEPKLTNGIISAAVGLGDDPRFFQVTVPVQAGCSGSPLLNMKGEVVGMVVAKLDAIKIFNWTGDLPENVNYAIKIAYVRALSSEITPAPAGSGKTSPAARLEELARRVTPSIALVVAE